MLRLRTIEDLQRGCAWNRAIVARALRVAHRQAWADYRFGHAPQDWATVVDLACDELERMAPRMADWDRADVTILVDRLIVAAMLADAD